MATVLEPTYEVELETQGYRSLSTGAILGLILALLSVLSLVAARNSLSAVVMMLPMPILGFLVSWFAKRSIQTRPTDLTGLPIAYVGMGLSAFFFLSSLGLGGYVYATEKDADAERLAFEQMKVTDEDLRERIIVPPEVLALEGKKVFMKGYMRPGQNKTNLREFLFVRDNQECCFGSINDVKFYDQIEAYMPPGETVDYHQKLFRVHGILHIEPRNFGRGAEAKVYAMEVVKVQ